MKSSAVIPAWSKILRGQRPLLSIEITRRCPLHCPGCYAYQPEHLGGSVRLNDLADFQGEALISGVLALVRRHRPLHVSIVGGEPLVRYRELDVLLPELDRMGVEIQLVTSAVRPVPIAWRSIPKLHLVVSIDGLPAEHDIRRAPATYDRILQHIEGHNFVVHCTVTRPMIGRPGYFKEFAQFWSAREEIRKIWFSLYTPQEGEESAERLRPEDRKAILQELAALRGAFPKVELPDRVLDGYRHAPASPHECIFAQTTACVSADLKTRIGPCQFGGKPVCSECGCVASAALASVGRYKLGGMVKVSDVFAWSNRIGQRVGRHVAASIAGGPRPASAPPAI
ncbi:MAG TPA: radical SAM protein [Terriglobia bacterium]|nr:radical SAM protein [Terriglobia bacterium]